MSETPIPTTETWEKTIPGGVWILSVDHVGNERPKRIKGPSGFRFKVHVREREAASAKFAFPENDPFRNGHLKRLDVPAEVHKEKVDDYNEEQALSNDDLVALLAKNGMAFQSAVKKLNEVNVRRLLDLGKENGDAISSAQENFLTEYIQEKFVKQTTGQNVN